MNRSRLRLLSQALIIALLPILLSAGALAQPYLHAPSVNTYARHNPYGTTILPDGRLLKPYGYCVPLSKWPTGVAVDPTNDLRVFVSSDNVGQFIWNFAGRDPAIIPFAPCAQPDEDIHYTEGDPVFSPDGSQMYWSSGDQGGVYAIDVRLRTMETDIPVNVPVDGRSYEDSYIIDVKISPDGRYLYCADITNFRVVVIDLRAQKVVGSIDVGRYPYALAVAGNRVYVANIGEYAYSAIPPPTKPGYDSNGISFPAFGVPSKEAENGVEVEGRFVTGLGGPNTDLSFSVWGIDMSDPTNPRVVSRYKPGVLIGAPTSEGPAVGGSAPDYLLVHGNRLYISLDNDDVIEAVDMRTNKQVMYTTIRPSPLVAKLRGVAPRGMAISADGSRLYVAEMGINAVGVIDTRTGVVLGHIPTAWYPYRVALSNSGKKLFCVCFRGFGYGPRGVTSGLPDDPFIGVDDANGQGALDIMDVPPASALPSLTKRVLVYNGIVDSSADRAAMASPVVPTTPGVASKEIKYIVFIVKENHTFDTIFDHVPGANSDPALLRWGYHQTIREHGEPTLYNVPVMVNHNALARQFALSDNFYVQPEASGVGHRWDVGVMPNNFCQMTYTLRWNFKLDTTAPGRRASFGGDASIAPEDYPEAGTLWDHLARNDVSFRNYGEGFEFAGIDEDRNEEPTGARESVNIPMEKVLFDNTCRTFPIFNTHIPDVYRADMFAKDITDQYIGTGKPLPSFLYIALCNDHGDDPAPAFGYPYVASYMADDDYGLGRIVEFLSHTKYWKNMAIFVTQDDAGSENDHIDAQRSVLLAISPWIKRHYVSHRHTTITSVHRTIYELLGLPPLSYVDALSNDFSDFFTTHPDFTPYIALPVDKRIFDAVKSRDPGDPGYTKAWADSGVVQDDPDAVDAISDSN